MGDKISVSLYMILTCPVGQLFCKSWLPEPKIDCPGIQFQRKRIVIHLFLTTVLDKIVGHIQVVTPQRRGYSDLVWTGVCRSSLKTPIPIFRGFLKIKAHWKNWPMFRDIFEENGTHMFMDFLWKSNPLEQHIRSLYDLICESPPLNPLPWHVSHVNFTEISQ